MANLVYDFQVIGAKNVERAFASIERRATQHNLRMSRAMGGPARASGGGGPKIDTAARLAEQMNRRNTAARIRDEKRVQLEQAKTARKREADARKYGRILSQQHKMDMAHIRRQRAEAQRAASAAMRERRRTSGALFGRAGRSAGGALRAVGGMATGALAIGGGLAMGSAVSQQVRETRMASQLANQAGDPGLKRTLLKESQSVKGFTGEETLSALTGFVDLTGDLATARAMMRDMAELSLATGASFEDVAAASGNFANNLKGIKDPAERAAKVMEIMRTLGGQAMVGAIELKDLAGGGAALGAAATRYSGDKARNIQSMGVFAQVAKATGGAESAAEAFTAIGRFTDMISTKSDKLEAMGVHVGDRASDGTMTQLADPRELIADIMDATKGDLSTISKTFGIRGQKVVSGFTDSFKGAFEKSGRAGVLAEFDRLMNVSLSEGDIKKRAASRLDDPDLQFKEVMKDFNAQVGSELLPVITKLIPEFAKLLPSIVTGARLFAKLVESMMNSPLMTLGSLIAGKVILDIAAAQIGSGIKRAVMSSITGTGGGGGPAGPSGGKGGVGNVGGAVLNGATIGAAIGLTIFSTGVVNFEASEVQMEMAGKDLNEARDLMREGGPEALKRMRELLDRRKKETDVITEKNRSGEELFGGIGGGAGKMAMSMLGTFVPGMGQLSTGAQGIGSETAKDIGSTLGIINKVQEKTNADIENQIAQMIVAMEAKQTMDETAAGTQKTAAEMMLAAAKTMAGNGPGKPPARPKQEP